MSHTPSYAYEWCYQYGDWSRIMWQSIDTLPSANLYTPTSISRHIYCTYALVTTLRVNITCVTMFVWQSVASSPVSLAADLLTRVSWQIWLWGVQFKGYKNHRPRKEYMKCNHQIRQDAETDRRNMSLSSDNICASHFGGRGFKSRRRNRLF
jgi:hypothetical protein